MQKTIIAATLLCAANVQAAPQLIPTEFDYRGLQWESKDGDSGVVLFSGGINSSQFAYQETFDHTVSGTAGTASQTSYANTGGPNSGPLFLYGTGSADAAAIAGRSNTQRSRYLASFKANEAFTATVSGTLEASYDVSAIFEAAAWVRVWDGDPISGTLIWSEEAAGGLPNEAKGFSYTHTFEAGKMYVLEVNAYSQEYLDGPEYGDFPHNESQSGSYEFTFALEVPEVDIDVLPGDAANEVYPNQTGKLPVAILSSADFDATQVDPATLKFGPAEAGVADAVTVGNVDGLFGDDVTARFRVEESGILCNDTEVALSGMTYAGDHFTGTDTIDSTQCESGGCHAY